MLRLLLKKITFTSIFGVYLLAGPSDYSSPLLDTDSAPCHAENSEVCLKDLGGFLFLKSFSFSADTSERSHEISYVLSKGGIYLVKSCVPSKGIEVTIFDSNRNVMLNTARDGFNEINSIQYRCSKTGIYYIRFNVVSPRSNCVEAVLAFQRPAASSNGSNQIVEN